MFRSDVVGSLLRPDYLVRARERRETGELSAAAFKRVEDRAVDEAIRLQEEAGLDVLTDGEQRRYAFFGHLVEALEGFDKLGGWAIPMGWHNQLKSEPGFVFKYERQWKFARTRPEAGWGVETNPGSLFS